MFVNQRSVDNVQFFPGNNEEKRNLICIERYVWCNVRGELLVDPSIAGKRTVVLADLNEQGLLWFTAHEQQMCEITRMVRITFTIWIDYLCTSLKPSLFIVCYYIWLFKNTNTFKLKNKPDFGYSIQLYRFPCNWAQANKKLSKEVNKNK